MIEFPVACTCCLIGFLCMVLVETVLTYHTLADEHQVLLLILLFLVFLLISFYY